MRCGVGIILHGNGSSRGTPYGRQLAFGACCLAPGFDSRSSVSFSAQGCNGSFSPGLRAAEMSMMKWPSGPHSPDRFGLPSGVRGAARDDFALRCSRLVMGTPPPAGLTPRGSWAMTTGGTTAQKGPPESAGTIDPRRNLFLNPRAEHKAAHQKRIHPLPPERTFRSTSFSE